MWGGVGGGVWGWGVGKEPDISVHILSANKHAAVKLKCDYERGPLNHNKTPAERGHIQISWISSV